MTAIRKTQKTAVQDFVDSDPEAMKLFQQERAILEATELICEIMAAEQVSRTELAKRLGKTKGYVTQVLDGQTNMTIRTMSDVFLALGRVLHVREESLTKTILASEPLRMVMDFANNKPWDIKVECMPVKVPA